MELKINSPHEFAYPQILQSTVDNSVNWIDKHPNGGYLESRYVRREDRYFVVYLSSQTGCRQACRMCHLTATGQNTPVDASQDEILAQARRILDWYLENTPAAQVVHFNFMARGEPLSCESIINNSTSLLGQLAELAQSKKLLPRYLISTIMPKKFSPKSLVETFPIHHPEIYYSLYSTSDSFRKRWLPRAISVDSALSKLADWQYHTAKIPKIHFAFIEEENDSIKEVENICTAIQDHNLRVNFNIVRYNPPPNSGCSKESDEKIISRNVEVIRSKMPTSRIKVHPRVGIDVKASCGMFIS